ncbi:hypothetical protein H4R19_004096 [Coemansia spiralis]|nr:hypothetical protein H4R19_004096 [Coemansia spiralis]
MADTAKELAQERARRHAIRCATGRLLRGGVLAIVSSPEMAVIAEKYGARGVIVAGATGGSKRATDPQAVKGILENIMVPVFARVSVGHTIEGTVMESSFADGIDECEILEAASSKHLNYHRLAIPVMSSISAGSAGAPAAVDSALAAAVQGDPASINPALAGALLGTPAAAPGAPPPKETGALDDALKKIFNGAAVLRTAPPPPILGIVGSPEDMPKIRHLKEIMDALKLNIKTVTEMKPEERAAHAKQKGYSLALLNQVVRLQRLPVPLFAHGGIMFPLDAAMAMDLGYDGVITSVNVFQAANPEKRMRSLVLATTHYKHPGFLARITEDHGAA